MDFEKPVSVLREEAAVCARDVTHAPASPGKEGLCHAGGRYGFAALLTAVCIAVSAGPPFVPLEGTGTVADL